MLIQTGINLSFWQTSSQVMSSQNCKVHTPVGMIGWFGKLMQNHVARAFTIICYFWSPQKHQKCINHGPHKTFLMEVGEILRNGSDDIHIWRVCLKYVQLQYLTQKAVSDIIVLSWKLSQYGHFFCCGVLRKKVDRCFTFSFHDTWRCQHQLIYLSAIFQNCNNTAEIWEQKWCPVFEWTHDINLGDFEWPDICHLQRVQLIVCHV